MPLSHTIQLLTPPPADTHRPRNHYSKRGRAKKMFEEALARRIHDTCNTPTLVDLDLATGLPRTIRVKTNDEEGFFYDNSALANGLIRAISRQISLYIFTKEKNKKTARGRYTRRDQNTINTPPPIHQRRNTDQA